VAELGAWPETGRGRAGEKTWKRRGAGGSYSGGDPTI
jgi:hypothetical protein